MAAATEYQHYVKVREELRRPGSSTPSSTRASGSTQPGPDAMGLAATLGEAAEPAGARAVAAVLTPVLAGTAAVLLVGYVIRPVGPKQHPDLLAMRARYAQISAQPTLQAAEGLTLLTGLYLGISPWVVGFTSNPLTVSNLVTGIALAVLALGFGGSAYEPTLSMGWVATAIGAWAIIAPWVVQHASATTGTTVSNTITGAVAIVLGGVTTAMAARSRH